jgi:hypothetical protein
LVSDKIYHDNRCTTEVNLVEIYDTMMKMERDSNHKFYVLGTPKILTYKNDYSNTYISIKVLEDLQLYGEEEIRELIPNFEKFIIGEKVVVVNNHNKSLTNPESGIFLPYHQKNDIFNNILINLVWLDAFKLERYREYLEFSQY